MASPKHRHKHLQKHAEAREQGLDHQKLKKRAAELRRAEESRSKAARRKVRRDDWEDLVAGDATAFEAPRPRAASTEAWLARLQAERAAQERPAELDALGLAEGVVVAVAPGACRVRLADGSEVACTLADDLRRRQRTAVAVGDRALCDRAAARVRHVLPRTTSLSRPDPHDPAIERVIAANVDLALVVAALREPRLSVGLVERVVLAAGRGGVEPVVCATKVDLAPDAGARERDLAGLAPLARAGVRVLACSARTGEGLDALRALARGRTCVLVGHSGVGKSTLLNALAPGLDLATGGLRAADKKGRHTTTASSLHLLPDGTRVIDTPGVRQFGLARPAPDELAAAFPDVAAAARACRFRDCAHVREPGCGVRAAVAAGALPPERLASYLRIRDAS